MKKLIGLTLTILILSGCAGLPPIISYGSNILTIGSILLTEKTVSDHLYSEATGKDCSSLNLLEGEDYCYYIYIQFDE